MGIGNKEKKVPEVRFKGFSDEWEQRKVLDLSSDTCGGGTPKTNNSEYWQGEIPWIQSSDLFMDLLFNVKPKKYITENAVKNSATKIVPANSIAIVTRVGVGKLAFMPYEFTTSQDFLSLANLKIDPFFGVYSLYKMLQNELNKTQGTSIKGITKSDLLDKIVAIPRGFNEQQKIGTFFKQLDDTIALHQRKLALLKALKRGYLQQLFPKSGETVPTVRFADFDGDWEQRKLGEVSKIGDIDHRMPPSVDDGTPYLMTGDFIEENELNFENTKLVSEDDYLQLSKKIKPEYGDILFARYASVGAVRYVSTHRKFLISYSCAIIKPFSEIDGQFLYSTLKTQKMQQKIEFEINPNSQKNIGIDSLKKLPLFIPKMEEQHQIGSFFKSIDNTLALHQQKTDNLINLKKAYLQKMFP